MDRPLSLAARVTLWFVAINALIGATSLILFPTRTATLFFWEITPPINAALFGALYLSGAFVVSLVTARGLWEPARFLVPVLVTAGALISGVTVLHLDRFAPGVRLAYWLLVYVGAPLLALWIYMRHERPQANWQVTTPVKPVVRGVAVALGALLLLLGTLAILFPAPVVARWPWPTTPLMTRIFAAWFAAFGAGLLWFWVERDWERIRLIPIMMMAASGLDLLVLFIHRGDVPQAGLSLWLFVFHLALFGLVGAWMVWGQREGSRE
jgi:preprotein translocase subunit Sec61beta